MASEKPVADPTLANTAAAPAGSSSSSTAPPTTEPAATAAQVPLPDSTVTSPAPASKSLSVADTPNRPLTPNSANRATLQEAFPNIDAAVIRAVLIASGGQLEPAFNALLAMSDPNAAEDEISPPPPPRNQSRSPRLYSTTTPQTQLDADAELALRLQQEYMRNQEAQPRRQGRNNAGYYHDEEEEPAPPLPARRHQDKRGHNDSDEEYYRDDDRDHSFFDDDLPVIKDNIKKGFLETQSKVNSWLSEFKKKLDGESPENSPPGSQRNSSQYARTGNRRSYDMQGRRSTDRNAAAYDADPAVLSDDFTHLAMKDNTTDAPQNRRPKANPNLFQPTATSSRKVSFDDRTTTIHDDDDLYRKPGTSASPARGSSPANAGAGSKWKPLQSVEPAPLDRDPFSLGDSDDEKDGLMKEGEPAKTTSVTSPQESGIVDKSK